LFLTNLIIVSELPHTIFHESLSNIKFSTNKSTSPCLTPCKSSFSKVYLPLVPQSHIQVVSQLQVKPYDLIGCFNILINLRYLVIFIFPLKSTNPVPEILPLGPLPKPWAISVISYLILLGILPQNSSIGLDQWISSKIIKFL